MKKNSNSRNFQSIRITSGIFRGRELKSPASKTTHPMGSRERLALFNSLGPDVLNGAFVLDAFAGTGAIGFEALSRGAMHVSFIEKNNKAAKAIEENINLLGVNNCARLFTSKVESLQFDQKFDIVFADPPYDFFVGSSPKVSLRTLDGLAASAKKCFILSHPAEFDPHLVNANLQSTRSYAAARISIFTA